MAELPVHWTHMQDSRVRLVRDAPRMLRDTVRTWHRVRKLHPREVAPPITDPGEPSPPADPA
ncbi:hypothetical protein B7486_55305 [cyanobacterium TDX16]|nr:hypothetical protein B7486_55305 [cyanobacterium TDX16]